MIDLKPACRGMVEVLGGVTDEQLTDPTPCHAFTVGDLMEGGSTRNLHGLRAWRVDLAAVKEHPVPVEVTPNVILSSTTWSPTTYGRSGSTWDDPVAWTGGANVPGSGSVQRDVGQDHAHRARRARLGHRPSHRSTLRPAPANSLQACC